MVKMKTFSIIIVLTLGLFLFIAFSIGNMQEKNNPCSSSNLNPSPPEFPLKPFPSFDVNYLNVTLEEAFPTVHIHRGSLTTITIAVDRVREDVAEFAPLIYVSSEMFTGGRDEAKLVDRINNYVDGMTINLNPSNIIFSGVEKRAYAKLTINVSQSVNPGTYWIEILVPLKEGKGFGLHSLRIVVEEIIVG